MGGASFAVSPASSTLLTSQGFELGLILQGTAAIVTGLTGTLDGADVSGPLAACTAGNVGAIAGGGQVLGCAGLTGGVLGAGLHTFETTVTTSDGGTYSGSATWDVKPATEP